MGRKKTSRGAPAWAVDHNPFSKFAFIYVDQLKSPKFLGLSRPAQLFYIFCVANAHDDTARACLTKYVEESNDFAGRDKTTDIQFFLDSGYFVFPAKHMRVYGYTRSYGWKLMQELIEAGFVDIKEQNKHRRKVNLYAFSTRWKYKTRAPTS